MSTDPDPKMRFDDFKTIVQFESSARSAAVAFVYLFSQKKKRHQLTFSRSAVEVH